MFIYFLLLFFISLVINLKGGSVVYVRDALWRTVPATLLLIPCVVKTTE